MSSDPVSPNQQASNQVISLEKFNNLPEEILKYYNDQVNDPEYTRLQEGYTSLVLLYHRIQHSVDSSGAPRHSSFEDYMSCYVIVKVLTEVLDKWGENVSPRRNYNHHHLLEMTIVTALYIERALLNKMLGFDSIQDSLSLVRDIELYTETNEKSLEFWGRVISAFEINSLLPPSYRVSNE